MPSPATEAPVRRSHPLLATLASRFILVAAIPFISIALLFQVYYQPLMHNTMGERQQQAADAISRQIERHFAGVSHEIGSLSQLLLSAPELTHAQIETLLDAYAQNSGVYDALYLSNDQGRIEAIGLPADQRSLRNSLKDLDISGLEFVRRAHLHHEAYWSNSFRSTLSAHQTVALAQPVGQRTLVGEVAIEPITELARQLSLDGDLEVRLFDRQTQLLADTQTTQTDQALNLGNLPILRQENSQLQAFELNGQPLLGVLRQVAGPDWRVLVAQPAEHFNQPIHEAWRRILLALGLALGVAVPVAGFTSWRLAKKLSEFTEHVGAIAEGNYDLPLPTSSISELNRLRQSLRQMLDAIREREQAMAATAQDLHDSEDRLLATLENTPNVAVQWFDAQGHVLLWNHASETIFGIAREEALGKTLDQLVFSAEQAELFLATLREAAKGVALGPYLSDLTLPNGQQIYVLGTTFSIPAPNGGQYFVCMDIDVTEQKKTELAYRELNGTLEQHVVQRTNALSLSNQELSKTLQTLQQAQDELVRSEKLVALGSLVAGIAHELNTPIGNSLMAATTLEDHTKDMAAAIAEGALRRSTLDQFVSTNQTATDILIRNLRRASELISSFKQVAVDQASSQRRNFHLIEVVNEIIITLGPTLKKTPFKIDCDIDDSLWLDSYPGALGQILVNLINNALLHGFDGRVQGLIKVQAYASRPGWVELTVTDNGNGIAEDNLQKIFDPFFTTKLGQGGSGLGLNIVHNLATGVLGGRIEVASQVDWGTRFTLLLPLTAPSTGSNHSPVTVNSLTNSSQPLPDPAAASD